MLRQKITAACFAGRRQQQHSAILARSAKYFGSAKPAQMHKTEETTSEAEQEPEQTVGGERLLKFVQGESNLNQVFHRAPNDGLFPTIKHRDEIEAEDIQPLVKANLTDIIKQVIERETELGHKLQHSLISQLHDKDGRLTERIYERLLRERLAKDEKVGTYMTPLHYNMMIQSAAVHKRHRLLAQLVLETTVLDVPLDTQSYIKTIIATHYDRPKTDLASQLAAGKHHQSRALGKDNLAYIYTLFEKDVPREDYTMACVLLQEYVSTVSSEVFENGQNGKSQNFKTAETSKRRRRSSKDKSRKSSRSKGEVDWRNVDPWTLSEEGTPVEFHNHGKYQEQQPQQQIVLTPDQFEYDDILYGPNGNFGKDGEGMESKKRHALYKTRMAELQQYKKLLKQQSKKNGAKAGESEKTSKHIEKYRHKQSHQNQQEEPQLKGKGQDSDAINVPDIDPEMQKQIDAVAQAMVAKIYREIVAEAAESSSSFTLKKFYEKNSASQKAAAADTQSTDKSEAVGSGSEDLELTSGAPDSTMPKREPVQISSEELDDNTELEQAKELMRNELSEENKEDGSKTVEEKVSDDEDSSGKK